MDHSSRNYDLILHEENQHFHHQMNALLQLDILYHRYILATLNLGAPLIILIQSMIVLLSAYFLMIKYLTRLHSDFLTF